MVAADNLGTVRGWVGRWGGRRSGSGGCRRWVSFGVRGCAWCGSLGVGWSGLSGLPGVFGVRYRRVVLRVAWVVLRARTAAWLPNGSHIVTYLVPEAPQDR
eukprot:7014826-Prymnesium_polylepis.1